MTATVNIFITLTAAVASHYPHINLIVYSYSVVIIPYSGFFEGENFHEFHESIAIRENFTLEIFTKSIRHCVLLMRFMKIFPLEKLD